MGIIEGWLIIGFCVLFLHDVIFDPIKRLRAHELVNELEYLMENSSSVDQLVAQSLLELLTSDFSLLYWVTKRMPMQILVWPLAVL